MNHLVLNMSNKKDKRVLNAVYIGRSARKFHWGNPFSHLESSLAPVRVQTRELAIQYFREWVEGTRALDLEQDRRNWIIKNIRKLHGVYVKCYCSPLSCHGDILVEMATDEYMKEVRQTYLQSHTPMEHDKFIYRKCCLLTDHPEATKWNGRRSDRGEPVMDPKPYIAGQIVRCVMISRFGDVGITDDLSATHGYDLRVRPNEIEILKDLI